MRRGEVWLVNLSPTIGAEITKARPAVIMNDDAVGILPLKVVVPITEWKERYAGAPWMVRLQPGLRNGLSKLSAADTFQVRSVSAQRLIRRLGALEPEELSRIGTALQRVLALPSAAP
jgi:mRNA interferase MazF